MAPLPVQPSTNTTSARVVVGGQPAQRVRRRCPGRARWRRRSAAGRGRARTAPSGASGMPTGVPARARETSTGPRPRSASTSLGRPRRRRCASRAADVGAAPSWNSSWYCGARLVLHRQRLGVVGAAALDGLLALLGRRLQRRRRRGRSAASRPPRGAYEENAGPRRGSGSIGGPFRRMRCVRGVGVGTTGTIASDDLRRCARRAGRAARRARAGRGCRAARVHDERRRRRSRPPGDVVGVPRAGAVGRVVVGGEGQPGADRVAGVVHGQHRRAGGGRDSGPRWLRPAAPPGRGHEQRRVHQLLEAQRRGPGRRGSARRCGPLSRPGRFAARPGRRG